MKYTNKLSPAQAAAVKEFVTVPTVEMNRSTFLKPFTHKTTFNAGKIVPIMCEEVLPGDTKKIDLAAVVRSSTPITPVMDSAYLDLYAFFVPNRLVWDQWKQFMGQNDKDEYYDTAAPKAVPVLASPAGGFEKGSVADYLGLPIGKDISPVNHLPFRGVSLIYNRWFRDQNNQKPALTITSSALTLGAKTSDGDPLANAVKGGALLPIGKYHDYFTSALPSPQKAEDVLLPLAGIAPVTTLEEPNGLLGTALQWNNGPLAEPGRVPLMMRDSGGKLITEVWDADRTTTPGGDNAFVHPTNLYADLTKVAAATINDLRLAFQTQRFYERDARSGTRYIEMIKSHFGVDSEDGRLQNPELLGSSHTLLQQQQVMQTSSTDGITPLGTTGAMSLTGAVKDNFVSKSFTEHGHIFVFAAVRARQTYSQGIHPMFSRSGRLDFYDPAFANIGEQPILNKEIFADGSVNDDKVFGYKEPWGEYRFNFDRVTSSFRADQQQNLAIWHYANNFANLPVLQNGFIEDNSQDLIDRTLIVKSSQADQFIADFEFSVEDTRVMPVVSVPGMIDHN